MKRKFSTLTANGQAGISGAIGKTSEAGGKEEQAGDTHPAPRTGRLAPAGKGGSRLPSRVRTAGLRRHCPAWAL